MREKKGEDHELQVFIHPRTSGEQVCSLILKVHYKIGNFWLYIVTDSINEEKRNIMPSKWSEANREGL